MFSLKTPLFLGVIDQMSGQIFSVAHQPPRTFNRPSKYAGKLMLDDVLCAVEIGLVDLPVERDDGKGRGFFVRPSEGC